VPYRDSQERLEAQREWRRSRSPEYHRWLYDRRAFRFWKAETFERILNMIASGQYVGTAEEVAVQWLQEAELRETKLGRYFDHEENRPTNEPSARGGRR